MTRRRHFLALIATALAVVVLTTYAEHCLGQSGTFRELATFGGAQSWAQQVSADGSTIVGSSQTSTGYEATAWVLDGTGTTLGTLGGNYSSGEDVSGDGRVVVGLSLAPGGSSYEAFVWTVASGMIGIGTLPGSSSSFAFGVSDDGSTIVGGSDQAFVWTAESGMVGLGTLGGSRSAASAVSGDGSVIVGYSQTTAGPYEAFVWTVESGMVGLGTLGGVESVAYGVSGDGSVVVGYIQNSDGGYRAFAWTASSGMLLMDSLSALPSDNAYAWTLTYDGAIATGIIDGRAAIWNTSTGEVRELQAYLLEVHGIDTTGWNIDICSISGDGRTFAGGGVNPEGQYSAWVATIELNSAPVADAGADRTVECATAEGTTVALDGRDSSDPDGDALVYEWSVPDSVVLDNPFSPTPNGLFPDGPTLVTLTVTDGNGGMDVDDVLITVVDTTPPVLICTTDMIALWPPQHQIVDVGICIRVTDNCAHPEDMLLSCRASSNELDDGAGDGSFTGDVDGANGYVSPVPIEGLVYSAELGCYFGSVSLRAERDGSAGGRVYSIVCDILDTQGNLSIASCVVVVPHDKRRN